MVPDVSLLSLFTCSRGVLDMLPSCLSAALIRNLQTSYRYWSACEFFSHMCRTDHSVVDSRSKPAEPWRTMKLKAKGKHHQHWKHQQEHQRYACGWNQNLFTLLERLHKDLVMSFGTTAAVTTNTANHKRRWTTFCSAFFKNDDTISTMSSSILVHAHCYTDDTWLYVAQVWN